MIKTIRVMLIPNNKQKTKLFQYANIARFAYNWALAKEQENYKDGSKFLSDVDLRKEFTKMKQTQEYAWLNAVLTMSQNKPLKMPVMPIRNSSKDQQSFLNSKAERNLHLPFTKIM